MFVLLTLGRVLNNPRVSFVHVIRERFINEIIISKTSGFLLQNSTDNMCDTDASANRTSELDGVSTSFEFALVPEDCLVADALCEKTNDPLEGYRRLTMKKIKIFAMHAPPPFFLYGTVLFCGKLCESVGRE